MIRAEGTQALIKLEDDAPEVLFERVPGTDTMIWPLLRWPLSASAAEHELGTIPIPRRVGRAEEVRRLARGVLPGAAASARVPRGRDVLFVTSGATVRDTALGRENWLLSAYTDALGDSAVVVQDRALPSRGPRVGRPMFADTYTFDDAAARVDLRTRLSGLSDSQARHAGSVIREIFAHFDYPVDAAQVERVERTVLYRLARLRHTDAEWARMLDRVEPRLVVMDLAAYGPRSTLLAMLADRDIPVVEPQHGWIGPSHAAYNYGDAARTTDLSRRLPGTLLTFGEFWSDLVSFPGERVAVGKPHLEAAATSKPADPPRRVLVVSSAVEPDELSRIVLTIRDALPADWNVTLRPHPSERQTLEQRYPRLMAEDRVDIDTSADVYDALRGSRVVFGMASTVLYEALAFGVRVVVIDSALAPYYVDDELFGERVHDSATIRDAVASVVEDVDERRRTPAAELERVWRSHATENIARYLGATLQGGTALPGA